MAVVHFPTRFFITDAGFLPASHGASLIYKADNPLLPPDHEWQAPWMFTTEQIYTLVDTVIEIASHTDLIPVANRLQQAKNGYDIELSIMRMGMRMRSEHVEANVLDPNRCLYSVPSDIVSDEDVDPVLSLQISELPYLMAFFRALTKNNLDRLTIIQSQEFELSDLEAAIDTSELHSIPGCVS